MGEDRQENAGDKEGEEVLDELIKEGGRSDPDTGRDKKIEKWYF